MVNLTTKQLMQAQALLAKWFHLQPSEIGTMWLDEFVAWVDEANAQIKVQAEAVKNS